jgi:hypothetical protein
MATIFDLPDQEVVDALQVGQGVYGGLTFGEHTDWPMFLAENLLAYESRISDTPIPQRDGEMVNGRWAAGRIVVVPFAILGGAQHSVRREEWLAAFNATDPRAEQWLVIRDHGGRYMVRARVVRRRIEQTPQGAGALSSRAVVELKLADPRIYDAEAWIRTALPVVGALVGGGFNLPVAQLPLNMTAGSIGDNIVENTGQTDAYPLIRVENPAGAGSSVTAFELTNSTTGAVVEVNTTITAGQILVIDMDGLARATEGPHIHIDGSSRYGSWVHPRQLWGLAPGLNQLVVAATGGAPIVRLDWLQPTL